MDQKHSQNKPRKQRTAILRILTLQLLLLVSLLFSSCSSWMDDIFSLWEAVDLEASTDDPDEGCGRSDGSPGPGGADFDPDTIDCPDGYWIYDGSLFEQDAQPGDAGYIPYLLIRQHTEVYGYDSLTEAARQAFDLCYGEYFSQTVREISISPDSECNAFFHFTMPQALTDVEWRDVNALYEAATISYSYRPFRYACGDDTVGKVNCLGSDCPCKKNGRKYHFYAGRVSFSDKDKNLAFDRLNTTASELLADVSDLQSDAEKCAFIAQYLVDHVTYFTDHYWEKKIVGDITVINSDAPFITAYGALIEGQANCFGYARAFDYLAKRAGLTSLVVLAYNEDETVGHAWNMVMVDGTWYQLDATWMDNEIDKPDMRWFLFEAGESAHAHYNVQSYARSPFSLPECASAPYQLTGLPL